MTNKDLKDMEGTVMPEEEIREDDDGNRGPTIVMQGVSGKRITADVKMVKIKKKSTSVSKPETVEKVNENTEITDEVKPTKAVKDPAIDNKASNTPVDISATKAGANAGKELKAESESPKTVKQEVKAVAKNNSTDNSADKSVETTKETKAEQPQQADKTVSKAEKNQRAGDKVETSASNAGMAKPKSADNRNNVKAPNANNRNNTTAKQPVKPAVQTHPTLGAVVDPGKSSLAATAARFAEQAAARKKAAEQRAKASSQRSNSPANYNRRGAANGAGGNSSGRGDNRGNSYGGNGGHSRGPKYNNDAKFMAKDKDEEPKLQSRPRKQATKRPAFETEILVNPKENSRSNFANRDSSPNRKNDHRRNKDADTLKRSPANKRRNSNNMFDDSEFERNRKARNRKKDVAPAPVIHAVLTNVSLPETITVKELAEALKKTAAEVIKVLMKMGVMATLNQDLDYDTASIIAGEFDIQTEKIIEVTEEDILFDDSDDEVENLEQRPPVVCVMGHVDHGKTSLLDRIRQSSVADGEAGGITQHIGAYMVDLDGRKITFLDTPGHEAFTTMRARGAQATDIAILVVAADDGVMPQTIEAINHAKAANTQIVVAINKMDRPGANIDKVKEELSKQELIPEEWGGSTVMVPVSAKTGEGIEELLEMVLLTADILDLQADPNRQAKGIVIEAKLDKQRGAVATLLVKRGTLKTGDSVVMGDIFGRIRAMTDARGKLIKTAGPSVPVEIIGLPFVPEAGETFYQIADEKTARSLAEKRRIKNREASIGGSSRMSLDNLFSQMAAGEVKDLNLIVKADVHGSAEAVNQAMLKLSNDEVKVNVIHSGVGAITETDIRLAEVSNAIVIGFNVRPAANVMDQAKDVGVDVRLYRVIYHAIEDVEAAMKGMLAPKIEQVELGTVEIRQVFRASNIGTIGGGYVTQGKVQRNCMARLVRDGVQIWEGHLASLKRYKDDVKEVAQGYECGISLENYNDIKEGDIVEAYEMKEVERD